MILSQSMAKTGGIIAVLTASLVQPTAAQDTRERMPPLEQCTPIYAVQKDGCILEKFFTCDAAGHHTIRAESYWDSGLFYIDYTDKNGNSLLTWSWDELGDFVDVVKVSDPFSMDTLKRDAVDAFDITHLVIHEWFADPIPSRFSAQLRLTGETIEVDGTVFAQAELEGQTIMNAFVTPIKRHYYIDFDFGTFPWGSNDEERAEKGMGIYAPLKVIFPNDSEFQRNEPQYGCGTLSEHRPTLLRQVKG